MAVVGELIVLSDSYDDHIMNDIEGKYVQGCQKHGVAGCLQGTMIMSTCSLDAYASPDIRLEHPALARSPTCGLRVAMQ